VRENRFMLFDNPDHGLFIFAVIQLDDTLQDLRLRYALDFQP
jgi:hypothetical protein